MHKEISMNSTHKYSLIATAVVAVLASGAISAGAAKPATVPTITPFWTIYAAGGSAEVNPLMVAVCRVLYNVDSYTDTGTTADSTSYRVFYGNLIAPTPGGGATGDPVMIIYKFNGGSYANGVRPQSATGGTLSYPLQSDILNGTLLPGATQGTSCGDGRPTYTYTNSSFPATPQQPEWGISDVEATMFVGVENNPTFPTANVVVQNHDQLYDLVEGVAVTANLFAQKASWTKPEIAGILDGYYTNWNQIYGDNNAPLPAGGIVLIDRNTGSGTKAAGNQFFLGYPGLGANALPPESVTFASFTQTALPTSEVLSDVIATSSMAQASDLSTLNNNHIRAISVLSMDTPPVFNQTIPGTNTYDFVKINGVAVDLANGVDDINGSNKSSYINAIKGGYDFFYQSNFNYRNAWFGSVSANTGIGKALLAVLQLASFSGAVSGLAFPAAAQGTLTDADRASNLTAGVTIDSRKGTSTSQLIPLFPTAAGAASTLPATIPTMGDPL
jgi:hypothetical protein